MAENWGDFTFNDDRWLILKETMKYLPTDSGKSFRKTPNEVEREVISAKHYENYITAIPFFNHREYGESSRAVRNYTVAGYLPTTVTTIGPRRCARIITKFRFLVKSDLEKEAGWREKEVMRKAKEYKSEKYVCTNKCYAIGERITFITEDDGVTHSATWDKYLERWVD